MKLKLIGNKADKAVYKKTTRPRTRAKVKGVIENEFDRETMTITYTEGSYYKEDGSVLRYITLKQDTSVIVVTPDTAAELSMIFQKVFNKAFIEQSKNSINW
jgi:hypothetical protein